VERVAETLDKLEEDVLHVPEARVRGRRRATIALGEPVEVAAFAGGSSRRAAPALTEELERRVQALLDGLAEGSGLTPGPARRGSPSGRG
jgi:hypothetical protein